mmetsp:Transcript_50297/g.133535  ORF Transcript_50297/g.133535 Transcript_50297/m.133535 type:complete len:212 (-) Transcript_50297:133-768(-)
MKTRRRFSCNAVRCFVSSAKRCARRAFSLVISLRSTSMSSKSFDRTMSDAALSWATMRSFVCSWTCRRHELAHRQSNRVEYSRLVKKWFRRRAFADSTAVLQACMLPLRAYLDLVQDLERCKATTVSLNCWRFPSTLRLSAAFSAVRRWISACICAASASAFSCCAARAAVCCVCRALSANMNSCRALLFSSRAMSSSREESLDKTQDSSP